MKIDAIKQESRQILDSWIASCTRSGTVSRNTVAIGIVVLDHLKKTCPLSRDDVISPGGEVKGARSGLPNILNAYGIPISYLKEVTTRQGHQDGQKLFEHFEWGNKLSKLTDSERGQVLMGLIQILLGQANDWLTRQNLKLAIDRQQAPSTWIQRLWKTRKSVLAAL